MAIVFLHLGKRAGYFSKMPWDPDIIARHCRDRIAATPVIREPFPHVSVSDLFPNDFYDDLLSLIPSFSAFRTAGTFTGNLYASDFRNLCPTRPDLHDALDRSANAIAGGLMEKFSPLSSVYARSLWPGAPEDFVPARGPSVNHTALHVVERRPGFYQMPHLDGIFRFIAAYVYLSQSGTVPGVGTAMYRVTRTTDQYMPLRNMFSRDTRDVEVELDRVNDYSRNTMFAFLNCAGAYHGIQPFDEAMLAGNRRLSFNLYASLTGDATEHLIGQGLGSFDIILSGRLRD